MTTLDSSNLRTPGPRVPRPRVPGLRTPDLRTSDPRTSRILVTPDQPGWDGARAAWNLSVDQRPAAVAFPTDSDDVVAIVALAREHGLRVAPQGTGHNAGAIASLQDTILLRTSRMRNVTIDPVPRRARVQAGALWQDVTEVAAQHGLAALAGSSPDVGVVGYTLGGGVSWLARSHGLACNALTAIKLVTADGSLVTASADSRPELFWALRGGGGSFGIVTEVEIRLLPLTHVYGGALFWPMDRAADVLHAWREWSADLPDTVTSLGRLLQLPPLPELPDHLRGQSFVVVETVDVGDPDRGAQIIAPLRALQPAIDTVAVMPVTGLSGLHMDPEEPVPGVTGDRMLRELPAEAIDEILRISGPGAQSPLLSVELRHLGGALARPAEGHGALATLDGQYLLFGVGLPLTPELGEAIALTCERLVTAVTPWAADLDYLNFRERPAEPGAFFRPATHARLREVKAIYDPADVFVSNHPISPAA